MIEVRATRWYKDWIASLKDRAAVARIDARIRRLSLGNPGDFKSVGDGVCELRVDYGPGYRVYYVQRREMIVILLCGGDKQSQNRDIEAAKKDCEGIVIMALETTLWDPVENLVSPEAERAYLEAAFEDGDPALIAAAIGDVARARGMSEIAKQAGLTRDTMYKAFRPEGNPTLETLVGVLNALGLKLTTVPNRV
jgi:putative addiction module killer protein/probable addiction module antidote protein